MRAERLAVIILASVVVAFLVYILFFSSSININDITAEEQRIDSLNRVIENLNKQHVIQDSIIGAYHNQVDSLNKQVNITKSKITQIKKEYGKKTDIVRSYNPTELDSFFTNRYK